MRALAVALLVMAATLTAAQASRVWLYSNGGGVGGVHGTVPPPTGCTNQLVLDYSNSCALIAQGWGQ